MPKGTDATETQVALYRERRALGWGRERSALAAGLSASWATRWEREQAARLIDRQEDLSQADLLELAQDSEWFSRTYIGHVSTPWQTEMDRRADELLETAFREFLIFNVAPGTGKSSWWLRFVCRRIVLNRRVRAIQGARTETNAAKATARVRNWLEAQVPVYAPPELVAKGLAVQPTRILSHDFGAFKPDARGGLWQRNAFTVQFADDMAGAEKEPTMMAFGADSDVIGNRADIIGWDDLVTEDNTRSVTALETLIEKWDGGMGESRLEPFGTGLLALFGQRIGPRDLFRYNLDKTYVEVVDGAEVERKKYTHFVMPAHHEDVCVGVHERGVARSWPMGCLLDADRLPWTGPDGLDAKRRSSPRAYEIQYQQREGTGEGALIEAAYVYGGADTSGVDRPGCLNRHRVAGQAPKDWGPCTSVISADPSASNYWGITWWLYSPTQNARALMKVSNRRMTADAFLDWNGEKHVGLLEDWWWQSVEAGCPVTHVIVEINAAQRYLLQRQMTREWMKARKVSIIPHTTHRNKVDPEMGLQILIEPYRQGWYDLPYGDVASRGQTETLARQLTQDSDLDDVLMSNWFFEHNLAKVAPRNNRLPNLPRASWQRRRAS